MKIFIETTIIVNWILMKMRIVESKKQGKSEEEILNAIKKRIKRKKPNYIYSFLCLETIKNNPKKQPLKFITSDLCLAEIFYTVADYLIANEFLEQGIPLTYFNRQKSEIKKDIKEGAYELVENVFDELQKKLLNSKKINQHLCWFDLNEVEELVLYKNGETHDSIMISQAKNLGSTYFVSEDSDCRRTLKSFSKSITPIDSQQFYHLLKKKSFKITELEKEVFA